jgi:tRNA (guanine37-N1)-methyltransferase
MAAARPAFKNVGLTAWKAEIRYLVAIWGDEGLDMPLVSGDVRLVVDNGNGSSSLAQWLAGQVNERHERNWNKIDRFVAAVRNMPVQDDGEDDDEHDMDEGTNSPLHRTGVKVPRSYDVVGDVAILYTPLPTDDDNNNNNAVGEIGKAILSKNKAIQVVAVRRSNLTGTERVPEQLQIIAGANRSPLMTTHKEYGISCVVDLNHAFFSPRMGQERLRICQQVARGEHVLVLFAGVCMDALQIAARTEAASVTAVELNERAVECGQKSHLMLQRNKCVPCEGGGPVAARRLQILQGDVLEIVPTFPRNHYHRILAPRPKEGSTDGDLGTGESGIEFLNVLLPVLRQEGGECHWYDFVADNEFPACGRTRTFLAGVCAEHGLSATVLHVANAGSVAMRQFRVCVDFRISPKN